MHISTEMQVGLTKISHLEESDYYSLPNVRDLLITGEAIASHLDLLYSTNNGHTLVINVCSLSDADLKQLQGMNFYRKAKNALNWLESAALKKNIDSDLLMRSRAVLSSLAELEIEMNINANLLVQS